MAVFRRLTREQKENASWLAHWLNDDLPYRTPPNPAGRERILGILNLLSQIQGKLRPDLRLWEQPEVEQMEKKLASITRAYRTWPAFYIDYRPGKFGDIRVKHMSDFGQEETQALTVIEALLKTRVLERLTFCATCKTRWIFRSKSSLKYCSRQCRQARYEATAKRKKQKKQHNHEYYERWLKRKRRKKHHA